MAKSLSRRASKPSATAPDKVKRMRVFAIESPSAMDVLENRAESQILQPVCKLLGHDFTSATVRSKLEFATALKHITSINVSGQSEKSRHRPLCLHLAAHGNKDGLALGPSEASWDYLGKQLWDFLSAMEHYPGRIILVISACGAEHQKITQYFARKSGNKSTHPFAAYVLTTVGNDAGDVYWHDSVVAWSIFYHQIGMPFSQSATVFKRSSTKSNLPRAGELKYLPLGR